MKIFSEKDNILGLKFLVQRDKSMENTEERREYIPWEGPAPIQLYSQESKEGMGRNHNLKT